MGGADERARDAGAGCKCVDGMLAATCDVAMAGCMWEASGAHSDHAAMCAALAAQLLETWHSPVDAAVWLWPGMADTAVGGMLDGAFDAALAQ